MISPQSTDPVDLQAGFAAALAAMDESHAEWAPTYAGYETMRLVELWAEARDESVGRPLRPMHATQTLIGRVDVGPTRRFLERIVASTTVGWGTDAGRVGTAILAYAHHLQDRERYALAADVFEAFIRQARVEDDLEMVPNAFLRLAYCRRMLGAHAPATAAYGAAERYGRDSGDLRVVVLARLGAANVMRQRGNYPAAAAAMDAVIADVETMIATAPSTALTDALARARHDRGTVAAGQNDYARALTMYYTALHLYEDELLRERVLVDLATLCADTGLRESARDAYLVAWRGGREENNRQFAATNLIRLAWLDDRETEFEQFRRALVRTDLQPRLEPYYHLYCGEGLAHFGRTEAARAALLRAIDVGQRHEIHEAVMQADAALRQLDEAESFARSARGESRDALEAANALIAAGRPRQPATYPAYTGQAVDDVVSGLRELRERVLVTA
jgi:tetratricopeptide (TPR) repeat protein